MAAEPEGANCEKGGAKVEVEATPASKKYVCNGKNGTTGFTEMLPSGKTETGIWAGAIAELAGTKVDVDAIQISFAIPLATAPSAVLVKEGESSKPGCPGVVSGIPKAEVGKLCLYEGVGPGGVSGAPTFEVKIPTNVGDLVQVICESELCEWKGIWAVTAS